MRAAASSLDDFVGLAEAYWLGPPVVPRGDLAGIERQLVKALADATARERLGSAALVLVQEGRIVALVSGGGLVSRLGDD